MPVQNYYIRRLVAFLLDYCLLGITTFGLLFVVSYIHSLILFNGVQIVMSIISFLYEPFLLSKFSTTFGKRIMNLYVIDVNGGKISLKTGILRIVGKFLSTIILGIGYILIFFSPKNQALHDKIANTIVVSNEERILKNPSTQNNQIGSRNTRNQTRQEGTRTSRIHSNENGTRSRNQTRLNTKSTIVQSREERKKQNKDTRIARLKNK